MSKNIILYAAILVFGITAPFIFPAFKVQLSILCVLIVLATTWNIQGGEMGYNSFGNILFYGLGMYLCCLLYTSPSPRDLSTSRMPSSA